MKIKNQICILQCGIVSIILTITIFAYLVLIQLLAGNLQLVEQEMFSSQSTKQLKHLIYQKQSLFKQFIDISGRQLIYIHQIALQIEGQGIEASDLLYAFQGNQDIPKRLVSPKKQNSFSFMCGTNKTETGVGKNNAKAIARELGGLAILFNQKLIDMPTRIHGMINNDPNIVFSYPCVHMGNFFNEYDPRERPWYKMAYKQYQDNPNQMYNVKFSPPYPLAGSNEFEMSLNLPQVNLKNEFIGAWTQIISTKLIEQYMQQTNYTDMIILANEAGVLMVHNFSTNKSIYDNFQNTSLTGFSQEDWIIIKKNDNSLNNCIGSFQINTLVCRRNTLYSKDYHIISSYMKQYQFYIIILLDVEPFQKQAEEQSNLVFKTIHDSLKDSLYFQVLACLVFSFISIGIMTIFIVKPINKISNIIQCTLTAKAKLKNYRMSITTDESTIGKLQQSFNKLLFHFMSSQLNKSELCSIFEQFKFPRTEKVHASWLKEFRRLTNKTIHLWFSGKYKQ